MNVAAIIGVMIGIVVGVTLVPTILDVVNEAKTDPEIPASTEALLSILPIVFISVIVIGAAAFITSGAASGRIPFKKKTGLVRVYHGTRVPMSTILDYGVPGLSYSMRLELMKRVASAISDLGIPIKVSGAGTDVHGVFITDEYQSAEKFAIMAPAYISDELYNVLAKNGIVDDAADYTVLAILDQIGEPKVLECVVDAGRFVSGSGEHGSVLNSIEVADIESVHVVRYWGANPDVPDTKYSSEKFYSAVEEMVRVAAERWNATAVEEEMTPQQDAVPYGVRLPRGVPKLITQGARKDDHV